MSMVYGLILVPAILSVYVIVAYWNALLRMGFSGEVIKHSPSMFLLDVMAIYFAAMVGYWTLHAWTGFTLPLFSTESMTESGNVVVAFTCFFVMFMIMRFNASDRFTEPTAAGIKESAVRSLLTLRIIDRAEEIFQKGLDRSVK